MVFPWQHEQWKRLLLAKQAGRLPHALLLTGMTGTGKMQFAEHFVRTQLCHASHEHNQEKDMRCQCHSCSLIAGKAHPNVLWIMPEKEGSTIKIDQVRYIHAFVNQTGLQAGLRMIIINPANSMNIHAANALLKTLEEPSSGAILILINHQTASLPATILSRCQLVFFPRPQTSLALAWLKEEMTGQDGDPELLLRIANGAPLTALQLLKGNLLSVRRELLYTLSQLYQKQIHSFQSPLKLENISIMQLLDLIMTWTMDLIRLKLGCKTNNVVNKDFIELLSGLQSDIHCSKAIRYLDYLLYLRRQLYKGVNLNRQLMIEDLLFRLRECAR